MLNERQQLGASGEELAAQFLLKKGYRILARNLKNRYGEIDILAVDGQAIVIVEVKTKANHHYGQPAEMITQAKAHKLRTLAQILAKQYQLIDYRIDVVAVDLTNKSDRQLEHFIAAV